MGKGSIGEDSMSEKTYMSSLIKRTNWPKGEWDNEPDKVSWIDSDTGLPCLAKRNHFGAWCGYVGVSPNHPQYGKTDFEASVHGGITYADECQEGPPEETICHVPEPGEPDNVWWFGFDCNHGMDYAPQMAAYLPESLRALTGVYRTLEYVKNECADLARQLKEVQ